MANELQRVEPPALPLSPNTYERPFMDQNSNILRLFFNRLTTMASNVFAEDNGGKFISFPYGIFYSTADQTASNANTGYAVTFNTVRGSSGVSIASNSRLTVANDGVYLLKTTLQLESTNASAKNVSVWIKKNGTNEVYSAHEYSITGSGKKDIANWNGSLVLSATDYVEIFWSTDDTNIKLNANSASSPRPAVASASIAIAFVSNS
tara:strand:+ start:1038 stop:1658 length:621 start_codon:yes stop_codon:yes gene_type:complete